MEKAVINLLIIAMMVAAAGFGQKKHATQIVIPAGSTKRFGYSNEEISHKHDKLKILVRDRLADTEIVLKRSGGKEKMHPI